MRDEFLLIETAAPAAGTEGTPTRPRVIGLAYGGGKINLPGWKYPVVVDLAGLTLPESVPLLANHENRTAARVGMVNARVTDNALEIEGEIVASGDVAEEIVAQAKAGADWQLSIGAEVKASELVAAGRQREVNGRAMDGSFYHIQQAVLREVSVVAVGADGTTRLRIVARFVLTPADGGRLMADGSRADGFRNPLAGGLKMAGDNREEAFHQWLKDNGIAAEGMGAPALAKLRLAFAAEAGAAQGGTPAPKGAPAPHAGDGTASGGGAALPEPPAGAAPAAGNPGVPAPVLIAASAVVAQSAERNARSATRTARRPSRPPPRRR